MRARAAGVVRSGPWRWRRFYWQLCVEVGKEPIPRKLVITSKTVNSAPQYTVRIKSWKTGLEPASDAFKFMPPGNAKKLNPDALIELDELPQSAPVGGMQ